MLSQRQLVLVDVNISRSVRFVAQYPVNHGLENKGYSIKSIQTHKFMCIKLKSITVNMLWQHNDWQMKMALTIWPLRWGDIVKEKFPLFLLQFFFFSSGFRTKCAYNFEHFVPLRPKHNMHSAHVWISSVERKIVWSFNFCFQLTYFSYDYLYISTHSMCPISNAENNFVSHYFMCKNVWQKKTNVYSIFFSLVRSNINGKLCVRQWIYFDRRLG